MAVVLVFFFFSQIVISIFATPLNPKTYKAAVLEHVILPYVNSPLETMLANVKVYQETAAKAALEGADILAFPEYGVVGFNRPTNKGGNKNDFYVYLPSAAVGQWVPCESPEKFGEENENHKVLEMLSCAARNNSIVLVVNLLTREPCGETNAVGCPVDGFYKFNTNIIFSKNGTLLARYHKRHLLGESQLQPAPKNEFEIIDVGFMKFGTFICFDAMYDDPLVDYVTKHGIRNLVLTTAWYDELPFLASPQLYNRMARGLGINLIVSNVHYPQSSRLGSGIYSSFNGAVNETYDISTPGRLVIAEIPIDPPTAAEDVLECSFTAENQPLSKESNRSFRIQSIVSNKPSSSPSEANHQIWLQSLKNFSHIFLESKEESVSVCENDLCCHLSYSFAEKPSKDLYTFAISNAYHPFAEHKFYMQVCSVMTCESADIETCGKFPSESTSAIFTSLRLTGSFATTTLFPSILATDLQSLPDSEWDFSQGNCTEQKDGMKYGGRITLKSTASKPIMVASIYGRVYDRD
uniref:Pantetheinase n=1 Tax=Hemiscolopendra marginata TaxID=943146 RepID=A0A646QIB4_9MYRI